LSVMNLAGVTIEGVEELEVNLKKMAASLEYKNMGPVYLEGAELVRDTIQQKAPLGPTGNLKRSPIAKLMPFKGTYVTAIAGIDRKIAPHAHLLEFGTVKMSPHPFLRPAWDETRPQVLEMIKRGAKDKVEGAV